MEEVSTKTQKLQKQPQLVQFREFHAESDILHHVQEIKRKREDQITEALMMLMATVLLNFHCNAGEVSSYSFEGNLEHLF